MLRPQSAFRLAAGEIGHPLYAGPVEIWISNEYSLTRRGQVADGIWITHLPTEFRLALNPDIRNWIIEKLIRAGKLDPEGRYGLEPGHLLDGVDEEYFRKLYRNGKDYTERFFETNGSKFDSIAHACYTFEVCYTVDARSEDKARDILCVLWQDQIPDFDCSELELIATASSLITLVDGEVLTVNPADVDRTKSYTFRDEIGLTAESEVLARQRVRDEFSFLPNLHVGKCIDVH